MTLRVRIRREALADLDEAAAFYEARQTGLGREFLLEMQEVVRRASLQPESFPRVRAGIRKAVAVRFPFVVLFEVGDGSLEVLSFHHTSREPRRW